MHNTACTTAALMQSPLTDAFYELTVTTPCPQCALDTLTTDKPLEYARRYLDRNLQMWVDAEDSLELY